MATKMRGMSIVAAATPIAGTPVKNLKDIGVNWVAALPYAYYVSNDPEIDTVSVCPLDNCPHGPSSKYAVIEIIQKSKLEGVKVMIKPQLWAEMEWVGDMEFDSEAKWDQFEINYTDFIMDWAEMARDMDVDLFCIGTELEQFVLNRPNYWLKLIKEIREVYKGKLTYAANWDEFKRITFWSELDFIGIDAYFPLSELKSPTILDFEKGWKPHKDEIIRIQKKFNKPVLFTEFGYRSLDFTGKKPGESNRVKNNVNLAAHERALQAIHNQFWKEDWFAGGFVWKWFHRHDRVGGTNNNRFTPQNKPAEVLLKELYKQ